MKRIIMGIQVGDRESEAVKVQELLTKHGCIIKTRLGLHEAGNLCSSKGLIILEFIAGKDEEVKILMDALQKIEDISVDTMTF
ncbi:hypothetical protein [Fusibacter sp. JL216-2]|uniref:hypothetical protein n=1 Tax=Fusibacter sp. JL216-2 TaxID=3071453 RepID=UPI003D3510A3